MVFIVIYLLPKQIFHLGDFEPYIHFLCFNSKAQTQIRNYLANRTQRVKLDKNISDRIAIVQGVPQRALYWDLLYTACIRPILSHKFPTASIIFMLMILSFTYLLKGMM
jgi:hypothetical protein